MLEFGGFAVFNVPATSALRFWASSAGNLAQAFPVATINSVYEILSTDTANPRPWDSKFCCGSVSSFSEMFVTHFSRHFLSCVPLKSGSLFPCTPDFFTCLLSKRSSLILCPSLVCFSSDSRFLHRCSSRWQLVPWSKFSVSRSLFCVSLLRWRDLILWRYSVCLWMMSYSHSTKYR